MIPIFIPSAAQIRDAAQSVSDAAEIAIPILAHDAPLIANAIRAVMQMVDTVGEPAPGGDDAKLLTTIQQQLALIQTTLAAVVVAQSRILDRNPVVPEHSPQGTPVPA